MPKKKVLKPRKVLHVVVEVRGGVAYVTKCPKGAICTIIDHDNTGGKS